MAAPEFRRDWRLHVTNHRLHRFLADLRKLSRLVDHAALYREDRVADLVEEVDNANSEVWFAVLTRCAQTQSNDLATFPSFGRFLMRLGEKKPDILIGYLDRMDENLARFLWAMLNGLMKSPRRGAVLTKINDLVERGEYLSEIAWHLRSSDAFDEGLMQRILDRALTLGDDDALLRALLAAVDQYETNPGTLIEGVFLPALARFASKGDMRWVRPPWFTWWERPILAALDASQATAVLNALTAYPEIEYSAEEIVAMLAKRWPERVIDFFGERQNFAKTYHAGERYRALPFTVHELREPLAAAPALLIAGVRRWFEEDETHFRFSGGQLLAAVFPDSDVLREQLKLFLCTGVRHDLAFVLEILYNYEGNSLVNDLCMDVVEILGVGDALLSKIISVLTPHGTFVGEFGKAEALARKKSEMEAWLEDPRDKVRTFAKEHIHRMEQWIAAERRSAEESIALRKLDYGEEPSSD